MGGAHHLQHRGADQAGEVADPGEADGDGRQDQGADLAPEIARSPAPMAGSQLSQTAKISRE